MQASKIERCRRYTRGIPIRHLSFELNLQVGEGRIELSRSTVVPSVSLRNLMAEREFGLGRSWWAPGNNKGNQFGTIRSVGITNPSFLRHRQATNSIRIAEKLWVWGKLLGRHDEKKGDREATHTKGQKRNLFVDAMERFSKQ
jgi:hypothetical protein